MNAWKCAPLVAAVWCAACSGGRSDRAASVTPTYDSATGRLTQLAHDSNTNGRADTWTDMDGSRPLRARVDHNEDGRIDRWEYYNDAGQLVKVGFSRRDEGKPDGWAFPRADGSLERVELSSIANEHRIDRREFYERSAPGADPALVRVEEDRNGDGRVDRWETYEANELSTIAWDQDRDGVPDRRLTYQGAVAVLIESDPDPSGKFRTLAEIR